MQPLIQANGQPRLGVFDVPPAQVNYRDYDLRSPMGRRLGALARWRRFHQFQYFGLISDQLIGGCALANLSLLGVGFVYLFQPATGRLLERRFKLPLGLGCEFSQNPQQGVCQLRWRGNLLRLENRAASAEKHLRVELDDGTQIDASFSEAQPPFQPMCIATPIANNGWAYAQKVAGVTCSGQVRSALGNFDLQALQAFAHHDWTAGFLRPQTCWNWACLSGAVGGRRLGLNLSCGVNETSFSENCLWLDGRLYPVSGVHFQFDRRQPLQPWQIRSQDGQVELRFEPAGMHHERVNALIVASDFRQLFGRFHGVLRPAGETVVPLQGQWGFVEDQYVKW